MVVCCTIVFFSVKLGYKSGRSVGNVDGRRRPQECTDSCLMQSCMLYYPCTFQLPLGQGIVSITPGSGLWRYTLRSHVRACQALSLDGGGGA